MAILITGSEAKKLDKTPTFKECYALVGCGLLEVVRLRDGKIMLVDEEGLCKDNSLNEIATEIAQSEIGEEIYIVGNAVLFDKAEAEKVLR
jgi:hypothetical protein